MPTLCDFVTVLYPLWIIFCYVSETASIEETELSDNSDNNAPIVAELVDHPNDMENIDFEVEFECLMIADIEDADADTTLGQHEKVHGQMILSVDAYLDGLPVPPPPQPPPEEVATPVDHHSTYIQDMFDLDVLQKIILADRQPTAQQNDNAKQNHVIDNGTQDDDEEIFTLEDIMNHKIKKDRKRDKSPTE